MTARGKFITLEGIDGAGKSSHLDFLARLARERGHAVEVTREPGGTPAGNRLREVVLAEPMSALAEALVMFAARDLHVREVIEPRLAAGTWVLCDRFSDSTYAYQCGGRGLAPDIVVTLERLVHPGLEPDATFLFDLDPQVAYARQRRRRGAPDKFEREQAAFFERVRDAYLVRARQHPRRFHRVDASGTLEEVRARLADAFSRVLP